MTNLKEINFGLNQFCGPAVLSALTGKSTDECASVISAINGQREVRGVTTADLIKAVEKLRFTAEKQKVILGSLYGSLMNLSKNDGMYIIMLPKHFVAVEVTNKKIYLIDNHSKQAVDASGSARLIQKVDSIYKVTPKNPPLFVKTIIKIEQNYNIIKMKSVDVYKDEKDNIEYSMGYIQYRNTEELRKLQLELNEMFERIKHP